MPFPIPEFWKLAAESRLFSSEECQRLHGAFSQIKGAKESADARSLSEWLVSQNVLTRYQAKVLLARRPGPFLYGDYKVQDRIDSGRLQGVFRAVHGTTRQPVCLLFLSGPQVQDPQVFARIKQALSAGTIKHSHVARLYHLVDLGAYKFAVLSDLLGRSLEEQLASQGPLAASEACRLARQIALGLGELHKTGQMHGEVRPSNIWLDPANNVKVLHVPLSRDPLSPPTAALLASGQKDPALQAAADYLAPELVAANRWPDHPGSDLYALGCTLYHMLTGQPPFAGGDTLGKFRRHAQEQPPLASQVNPKVPQAVAQVAAYLLAKDPAARYQQAAHVADALAAYIEPAAREPIADPVSSVSRAYETWLERHQPPARPAAAASPAAAIPVAAPVQAGMAAPFAVPMAQPAHGGFPGVAVAQSPLAGPVMAAVVAAPAAVAAPPIIDFAVPDSTSVYVSTPDVTPTGRGSGAAQRRQKQAADQRTKLIVGLVAAVVLVVVGFLVFSATRKPDEVAKEPPATPETGKSPSAVAVPEKPSAPAPPPKPVETGPPEEPLVAVEGGPMWESPTEGEPLDLRYLPATQMYLALRPAEILANAEGKRVLASLGIEEFVRQHLTRLSGTTPDNLELVILGFTSRGAGQPPAISLVARAIKPVDKETLKQNWNATQEEEVDGKSLVKGEGYTFLAPGDGQEKVMVAVPITDSAELSTWVAQSKGPPLLNQKLESLARHSDNRRHVTLLASPEFLQGEGRGVLVGTLGPLFDPVQGFLTNEMGQLPRAAMLSMHLSDWLFLELRMTGDGDQPLADQARLYHKRVDGLKAAVEQYCTAFDVSPYSRIILRRYPDFFEFVQDNTRAGSNSGDKQIVLRTALPTIAASNLAFGTHLAMLERNGPAVAAVAVAPAAPAGPVTLADRLKQKYTLSFDRDSLERTLDLISKDTGIPIKIEGGDLQMEGITKNQSFGLDEKDKPIFEILKTIMKKSNMDNKLIYVFHKIDGQDTVVVTTRAAAKKRKDAIPPELE